MGEYTANGKYIDKNLIIENMDNNTSNTNNISYKIDDLTTDVTMDGEIHK